MWEFSFRCFTLSVLVIWTRSFHPLLDHATGGRRGFASLKHQQAALYFKANTTCFQLRYSHLGGGNLNQRRRGRTQYWKLPEQSLFKGKCQVSSVRWNKTRLTYVGIQSEVSWYESSKEYTGWGGGWECWVTFSSAQGRDSQEIPKSSQTMFIFIISWSPVRVNW